MMADDNIRTTPPPPLPAVAEGNDLSSTAAEDAAAIMATLGAPGESEIIVTKPNDCSHNASPNILDANKEKQKKRKSSSSSSGSSPFKRMDDSEVVRSLALELKRRGYTVAIQLKTSSEKNITSAEGVAHAAKDQTTQEWGKLSSLKQGDDDDDEATMQVDGTTADQASTEPPPSKKAKTSTSTKKKKSIPTKPLSLPTFSFHPSTVSITDKNANTWDAMFNQCKTFHDQNNGALPLHYNGPQQQGEEAEVADTEANKSLATLCKWTKAQLTLWKRMRKDNKHNLSLDRIAKLHSLNFERDDTVKASSANVGMGADGEFEGMDVSAAAFAGVVGDNGNNNMIAALGEENGNIPDDQFILMSTGKNAQKWQDKFDELRRYKELHGE